jgi:type VI secretion system secreted protein VgrG
MTERGAMRVRIESTAHPDLRLWRLDAKESLSGLFEIDVDVHAVGEPELDPVALVGATMTLVFEEEDAGEAEGSRVRRVHAQVTSVRDHLDADSHAARFHMHLRPRAHAAGLTETYEVFVDKTVPEIVALKLTGAGLKQGDDFGFKLSGKYPPRDFVLQYRETDFAFVSRLVEHLGIAYRFDHQGDKDVLLFSDTNASLDTPEREIAFEAGVGSTGIWDLVREASVFPGVHVVDDYTDQHPKLDLLVRQVVDAKLPGEVIEWAAGYTTKVDGAVLGTVRAQERIGNHRFYRGRCRRPLFAGDLVHVVGHPRLQDVHLRIVDVAHSLELARQQGGTAERERAYECSFRAVPASDVFRPERRTPRPSIDGFVHAVTEDGPPGVAHLDEQGRYIVTFLFDRADPKRRKSSSARVRMMQAHAGPGYGIHFPLKPGIEVLVAFMEGDPDRPVIAGCVPNVLTSSPVTSSNPRMHRIETLTGVYIRMKDS